MKKVFLFISLLLSWIIVFSQYDGSVPMNRIFTWDSLVSFSLQSIDGRHTHLSTTSKKLLVIAFLSPECPLSKNYSGKLAAFKNKYGSAVRFVAVIPGSFEDGEVAAFKEKYLNNWQVLEDKALTLTHYVGGEVTPEVLVINGKSGALIYKGAIDDWAVSLGKTRMHTTNFYLSDALHNFLNNKQVLISYSKPVGCLINDF